MIMAEMEYCIPESDWIRYCIPLTDQAEEDYKKVLAAREEDEYTSERCSAYPALRAALRNQKKSRRQIVRDELESFDDPNAKELASRVWVRFVGDD